MKPYKISFAVHCLSVFRLKRQGLISHVNPPFYNEQHCRDIIEHSTDEEIRALGLDPEEVRNLMRKEDEISIVEHVIHTGEVPR